MSQPTPDGRAVVRALGALTTQVKRVADALTTPVVEYAVATDDTPTTPATTCSARRVKANELMRWCIRAAHHTGKDHVDETGYHWSDTVAVYPLDDGVVKPWAAAHPAPEQQPPAVEDAQVGTLTTMLIGAPAPQSQPDPADDEDTLRQTRREALGVLLSRAERAVLTLTEAAQLRAHVEAEIRDCNTVREAARGNRAHARYLAGEIDRLIAELEQAQAAIERVRAVLPYAEQIATTTDPTT